MNAEWKAFLQDNGAKFASVTDPVTEIESEQLISFKNTNAETRVSALDTILSTPTDRGLLKITGEDAESFLQNQLTNDILKLDDYTHQASAWCSPKGRIIANFRIFKREGAFYLSFANDLLEHVIKKLRMYVMMSKVEIKDITDDALHFSFAGKKADELMQDMLGFEINSTDAVLHSKSLILLRYDGPITRFDVFGNLDDVKDLWKLCKQHAVLVSAVGQHFLNIEFGQAQITAASSESWIPQMVNYIQVDGVDFKKGCYPGQEVVARLNYLGKTKRRMYRLEIESDELPETNASIKSEKDAQAGKILNAVLNSNNKIDALAVIKIAETENLLTMAKNNEAITVLDLPYSVNDE